VDCPGLATENGKAAVDKLRSLKTEGRQLVQHASTLGEERLVGGDPGSRKWGQNIDQGNKKNQNKVVEGSSSLEDRWRGRS